MISHVRCMPNPVGDLPLVRLTFLAARVIRAVAVLTLLVFGVVD